MEQNLYYYRAKVISVWDGDTIRVEWDLGAGVKMTHHGSSPGVPMRLDRIDAPELKGETLEAGRASRDYLRSLILDKEVIINTVKDETEKYGRYLVNIYLEQDGNWICINDLMVTQNLAVYRTY